MKKIVSIVTIFALLFLLTFSINIYAATLTNLNITTSKEIVHPGETVRLTVEFGEDLGSYTANVAYDNNLLEYVSSEGGTANDTGTKVILYYYDQTGGSSSRNTMSITFKAKEGIITSNPTNLSITLEGLANADASIIYDDITTPIIKDLVVEPVYEDYNISLNYTGNVIENEEKDMEIVISSALGRNYEHTRLIAEAEGPTGESVKLLATDSQGLEHDIIQSGWGDSDGEPIGGENVSKKLEVRGLFSGKGSYSITLKLVDRDNSDSEIASKTFQISVAEETPSTTPDNNTQTPSTPGTNNNQTGTGTGAGNNGSSTVEPETLPKTGNTAYASIIIITAILISVYIFLRKKK